MINCDQYSKPVASDDKWDAEINMVEQENKPKTEERT